MNEQQLKKRNWIKNAAIIFLSVMLVLTFFSNTILNYSLPEVAIQYVQSGSITTKIRGTGTIESADPYQVILNESRVISSVMVKQGETVEKGDILFKLSDQESQELIDAQKQLDALVLQFENALLNGDLSQHVAQNVQNGASTSVNTFQKRIYNAKAKVSEIEKKVEEWQKQVNALSTQISISSSTSVDTTNEQLALDNANKALKQALEDVLSVTVSGGDESDIPTVEQAKAEEKKKLDELNAAMDVSGGNAGSYADEELAYQNAINYRKKVEIYYSAKVAAMNAQTALDNKANNKGVLENLERQKAVAQANLDAESKNLEDAQNTLSQIVKDAQDELNLTGQSDAIKEQEKIVEELRKKSVGAEIVAPISGTIANITYTAGESTIPGEAAMVIQPEGKGFTLSFPVTKEQAKSLSVGANAEIVNGWYYEDLKVILTSIKSDPKDPGKTKILTFDVQGDVMAGQTLTLSVGDKSANYDLIVPNSAIREDNNGKFVLMIESKNTPVGTRYTATRVDIEVLATDDTQSAISGALYGWGEAIITTSTKPVIAGQQVRLADN